MGIVDKILMEARLDELNIQPKTEIGRGAEHSVYPALHNSDVVIKTGWNIDRFVAASRRHPDLVARVYKFTEKYIIVERLDTATVVAENKVMVNALNHSSSPVRDEDTPVRDAFAHLSIHLYTESEYFEEMNAYLRKAGGEVSDIWRRWEPFLRRIEKADLDGDAATRNTGYDKNGRLKLLDI